MTDILQGFLDDIVAHPENPSLWLILADWLEDQNDPHAELVRLTWAVQYEPDQADFKEREARVQSLLADGMRPVRPRRTFAPGMEFAWIPPGTFLMGSPEAEPGREPDETQHRVTLSRPFWLSVTPVTQAQYEQVMGRNPSEFDGPDLPVEQVSYEDAQTFCRVLTGRTGWIFALPTEAEWKYACRAGTTTPFHFGSILDGTQANCDGTAPYGTEIPGPYRETTCAVGSFAANPWGLYDMHGNVWEWCADVWYADAYQFHGSVDPFVRPDSSTRRVVRGGSWYLSAGTSRAARRMSGDVADCDASTGFRIALHLS